ncbi:hypothetical protein GCM10020000_35710 [Streptomyces olivoverticillatus]
MSATAERVEGAAGGELGREAGALNELHDQVEAVFPGPEVMDADDLRMIQTGCCLSFHPEAHGGVLVALVGEKKLDRHLTAQHFVLPLPDFTHAATAERLAQPVPTGNQHPSPHL